MATIILSNGNRIHTKKNRIELTESIQVKSQTLHNFIVIDENMSSENGKGERRYFTEKTSININHIAQIY